MKPSTKYRRSFLAAIVVVAHVVLAATASGQSLRGTVTDTFGSALGGASVTASSAGGTVVRTNTDVQGVFFLDGLASPALIGVEKTGFAPSSAMWHGEPELTVTLRVAGMPRQIVVSATRTATVLDEVAASVSALDGDELRSAPALTLDDQLRSVPGFSLFRRTGSRSANPTSQGVSLRGLGASGASRALVLYDGVPLNDPFGGWVYWDRVPSTGIEEVEVLRGGASALYGSGALAGIVTVHSRRPTDAMLTVDSSLGSEETRFTSATSVAVLRGWRFAAGGQAFATAGYVPVPVPVRGTADAPANVRYGTARSTIDHAWGDGKAFVTGDWFNESRQNGTAAQTNNTRLGEWIIGAERTIAGGALDLRGYGTGQRFNQTFTSITADRNSESLVRSQAVPAQQIGGSAQWTHVLSARQVVAAGFDARQVRGDSDETFWSRGTATSRVIAGGRQLLVGAFVEDLLRVCSRTHVNAALRFDRWKNYHALTTTIGLTPPVAATQQQLPKRSAGTWSPSVGMTVQATRTLAFTASGYGSFRAPTLNELYRTFRLGNVQTNANDALRPERLWGGQAGAALVSGPVTVRATMFYAVVHGAIGNRTLTTTPALITRQRQNIGDLLSRGLELETEVRLLRHTWMRTSYQYSNSSVVRAVDIALNGLAIPQVPRHAAAIAFGANGGRINLTAEGRYGGRQFDDDLNRFPLAGYFVANARVGYHFGSGIETFVAAENILDRDFAVAATPVISLGPPRLVRAGVRIDWKAHRK